MFLNENKFQFQGPLREAHFTEYKMGIYFAAYPDSENLKIIVFIK